MFRKLIKKLYDRYYPWEPSIVGLMAELDIYIPAKDWHKMEITMYVKRESTRFLVDELIIKAIPVVERELPEDIKPLIGASVKRIDQNTIVIGQIK